jgi:two-component system invasion response regulator UvrY
MGERVKILLIDDHPIVRDGCQHILSRRPDLDVAEADCAAAGRDANRRMQPDVILLDLELPDGAGLDMISEILADNPQVRIIVFSMYEDAGCVRKALDAGAKGYVTKNDDPNLILAAIDKVLTGSVFLGPSVAQALALAHVQRGRDPLNGLSQREREVVFLLAEGKSLSEIAADLAIGYKTAANIVSSLKQKLHIATSSALIKFAVEHKTRS